MVGVVELWPLFSVGLGVPRLAFELIVPTLGRRSAHLATLAIGKQFWWQGSVQLACVITERRCPHMLGPEDASSCPLQDAIQDR